MDLKGSLVDTSLKIYPSEKLIQFLKNHNFKNDIPYNIEVFINKKSSKKKTSLQETSTLDIHFNDSDLINLERIVNIVDKNSQKKNVEEESSDTKITETNKVSQDHESNIAKEKTDLNLPSVDDKGPYLTTSDIDWLYLYITDSKKREEELPYLHELLEGSHINFPDNEIIKRNPQLEARCVKLRAQQEAREYRKMTKGVDNVRMRFPEDSISYQMKQLNRQLIAIGQFIISIFAGFLFGFRGVEWMVGNLDFGFRLLLGVMCALIIALAEIYFLAKKLNEELSVPETTQLGGPPKFADDKNYDNNRIKKSIEKVHQD